MYVKRLIIDRKLWAMSWSWHWTRIGADFKQAESRLIAGWKKYGNARVVGWNMSEGVIRKHTSCKRSENRLEAGWKWSKASWKVTGSGRGLKTGSGELKTAGNRLEADWKRAGAESGLKKIEGQREAGWKRAENRFGWAKNGWKPAWSGLEEGPGLKTGWKCLEASEKQTGKQA